MKIFAANWKLNKSPSQTKHFFEHFLKFSLPNTASSEIVFFPSSTCLETSSNMLASSICSWGSQNSYFEASGAFTGEVSAQVVKEMGGKWILLGHSERRSLFGETDQMIAKKFKFVQSIGLCPMLCVGETLDQRDRGETFAILKKQLQEALALANPNVSIVVAYEPVWAIGTGRVATVQQVQEAHAFVDSELNVLGFAKHHILYGGSVKAENAKELIAIPHVNGFLVGGASLDPESFYNICQV